MRLAIIDNEDQVVKAWPDVASAHTELADELAEHLHPRSKRRRAKTASRTRAFLLAKQQQTTRI